jgi:16S rRNA (guanine(1405)-N(7))-methyltransferase
VTYAGTEEDLRSVEAALARSRRYAAIAPVTVRRLAARALLSAQGNVPEAIKRTKRGLHEIYGAYLPGTPPHYERMLSELRAARASGDEQAVRDALSSALAVHASTRERLPHLAAFYQQIFSRIDPPATIRDLACGFNPLARPWMGLAGPVTYLASDIDTRLAGFIEQALAALGTAHQVEVADLISQRVTDPADLTLLMKTVPCLERQQSGAGWDLIEAVNSPAVVVTFPTRSLGHRPKGMFQTYSAAFEAQLAQRAWPAERLEIPGELIYLVRKPVHGGKGRGRKGHGGKQ